MAILIYFAKVVAISALLYGYYHLFLRNKRFHHYNRFYLLLVALLSFIIPFLHIPVFLGGRPSTGLIKTLKVISVTGWEEPVTIYAHQNAWIKWLTLQNSLYFVYAAGVLTGLFLLVRSLLYIRYLKQQYTYESIEQLKIYGTTEPGTPFSFFRAVFWDNSIPFNNPQGQQIFRHELFHVKEKHSADILLLEIICCVAWFNPFFHLIKKEIKAIHEFLADDYAASGNNRYDYAELLVLHAIQQKTPSITHPFFHNQIKRRITMITQSNLVRRSGYISRVMALPLLFLLASAFAVKLTMKPVPLVQKGSSAKKLTVVIDAGHGGFFNGTMNDNSVFEKNITLSIAQKIKQLADDYNLNIVLTRNSDQLVGNATNLREDLNNRITIVNNAKSDLLVSIHVNSWVRESLSYSGFDAYISGRKDAGKSTILASAILNNLKTVYTTNDSVKQRTIGIQVLDKTNCPSVIIECGYLTNPKDVAFITDAANQEKVARKILEGIVQYGNAAANFIGTTSDEALAPIELDHNNTADPDNTGGTIQSVKKITAEELSKISLGDIDHISADMKKTTGYVFLKNAETNAFNIKEVNDYYTARHLDNPVAGYLVNVNMKDSLVDIHFTKDTVPDNKIFTKVEYEAEFPGGQGGWREYLFKTINYPQIAQDKEIKGTVVVQFIVDENGKISDVKAISGPKELRAESVRVIKESGTWTSAKQNGKNVKSYKRQPIIYKLERATT